MTVEAQASNAVANDGKGDTASQSSSLIWARATVADLAGLDFEAPVVGSQSADSAQLGDLFRAAADKEGEQADTPRARVFNMLTAVAGMYMKPQEPNEPFGAMVTFADGRRSAIPSDFRAPALETLAAMATRAKHPVLRARLADICWLLDRKQAALGASAAEAYAEIVGKVDRDELRFRFDKDSGALKFEARDLLRRALTIGRAIGRDKAGPSAARQMVADLRERATQKPLPVPVLWFADLDLDFGISDAADVGKDVEAMIARLPAGTDPHVTLDLWRLAARAYRFAKRDNDRYRCQCAAAEQLVCAAGLQPSALLASHFLSEAIAELHGIPGKKDRRKELHHRLVDVQAGLSDEMSAFAVPVDLENTVKKVEQHMQRPTLRDMLFVFAALMVSPDPAELRERAAKSIRDHPLSSLFGSSHHDREGKVVHRTEGGGFVDGRDDSAIERQIAQDERHRRYVAGVGAIEVARQAIMRAQYVTEDQLAWLLAQSPFVPNDVVLTYSRGFVRFFQGDFASALYILTPLLEDSLRHVLKSHGHDVTKFDDAKQTQEDRTISSLFDQMRPELVAVFMDAIVTDIENVFLKKAGPHLRHGLAHGLLHDGDPYGTDAIYGCWLIFRLCLLPLFPYLDQITLPYDAVAEDQANVPPTAPA